MGECIKCGSKTSLEYDEYDTGIFGYKCGKCRGYSSDKQYIADINRADKEVYREWKKHKR